MIYFLFGENSYRALRKIREFKTAFMKKAGDAYLVEEYDGDEMSMTGESFHSALGQISLFAKTRLVIFKNFINENIFKILKENGDFLKNSRDIFVFWEKDLTKHKEILSFFKKFAEKTQEVKTLGPKELDAWLSKKAQNLGLKLSKEEREVMIEEAGEGTEWALEGELEKLVLSEHGSLPKAQVLQDLAQSRHGGTSRAIPQQRDMRVVVKPGAEASPFGFIEKMFGPRAILALKEMALAGIEPQRFIYAFLWKLKQKKMADAYLRGILAESAMRRDPKNSEEILERFIFSLRT